MFITCNIEFAGYDWASGNGLNRKLKAETEKLKLGKGHQKLLH